MDKQRRLLQVNMVGLFENHFYGALALEKKQRTVLLRESAERRKEVICG